MPNFDCPIHKTRLYREDDNTLVCLSKGCKYTLKLDAIMQGIMSEGIKDDSGKLRYDLIPVNSLDELVKVYTIGAKKYGDRNWEKGISWGRIFAAMMRHAWAWWRGEKYDKIDGQHHLASVAWCAFALIEYEYTCNDLDPRNKQNAT